MALPRPFLEQVTLPAVFVLRDGAWLPVETADRIAVVPRGTAFERRELLFIRDGCTYQVYVEVGRVH